MRRRQDAGRIRRMEASGMASDGGSAGNGPRDDAARPRGIALRVLLLAGLALAVVIPFAIFAWLGDRELRRATKDNLGRHLMVSEARSSARRIADRLAQARELAVTFCSTPVLRGRFRDDEASRVAFDRFYARVSELLGSLLLVARPAKASGRPRVLFPEGTALASAAPERSVFDRSPGYQGPDFSARAPAAQLLEVWLAAVADSGPRMLAPMADPTGPPGSLSAPRDPEAWVLPLIIPIRDDTQLTLGVCVFLLPLALLQKEIEGTRTSLIDGAQLASTQVWIVDRATGRYLLHTKRDQIGQVAEFAKLEGFIEQGALTMAASPLGGRGLPAWTVGVRARAVELFRSVDTLSAFFLGLVVLVLVATLGIAALVSVAATRSLSRLEQGTAKLGAGDLTARAKVAGPREVRRLADAFNRMAARLELEQERLKHAERDQAWTKMARQVAHEIKNPLQPVRLHAELIGRLASKERIDPAQAERVRSSAAVILRQVDALRRIVADFSEYAQAALPLKEQERFPAGKPLAELVALYAAGGADEVSVVVHDESGGAELLGSPLRLQQVLVNLVKNAIEASADAQTGAAASVTVTARVEGKQWVVEVQDRGHGLPKGAAQRVFEPAFSTKAGGTGLGLAICLRNIHAMGGSLELLPREGGGTIARVQLPLQ